MKRASATFPLIYPESIKGHWDAERLRLYSPKSREWPYGARFKQIRDAAREQGVELQLGPATTWSGIDSELQRAFANDDSCLSPDEES